jgi:hypothetical protein
LIWVHAHVGRASWQAVTAHADEASELLAGWLGGSLHIPRVSEEAEQIFQPTERDLLETTYSFVLRVSEG